jgi:histidinol dehydrogenase
MRVIHASDGRAITRLITRDAARRPVVERRAARIVADVRRRGDAALREWNRRLDGWSGAFEVSPRALRAGWRQTSPQTRRAIQLAIRHLERVATGQVPRSSAVRVRRGVTIEQRVQPLGHVGCYAPGGRYPLVSTVIMTVVPARVAGVVEITVVCPAVTPALCCAALEAGATRVLRIGGAQAIAALAYGTRSIARADKIVGPGSAWVAAAKALVARDCSIDFHAGPSELVVWSDAGRADWIAGDLVAQAEHDPDARVLCVTTRARLARSVADEVRRALPAAGPAREAIRRNGAIVVARSRREAAALVNRIAPEHLACDDHRDAALITSAGTVFVGGWSAPATGDYVTGSNHVLPTGGASRFRGGLSAADFVRVFSVQTVTAQGLGEIGPAAITLAEAEGLEAHADSIRRRLGTRSHS